MCLTLYKKNNIMYVRACVRAFVRACVRACMHVCMYVCIMHIHVCTYTATACSYFIDWHMSEYNKLHISRILLEPASELSGTV